SPRANLPAAGTIRVHYTVAGGAEPVAPPPAPLRRWFTRFAPILASAARRVYRNDDTPLSLKLPGSVDLLVKQINMLDLLGGGTLALAAAVCGSILAGWGRRRQLLPRRRPIKKAVGIYPRYEQAARQAGDLTGALAAARQNWDARLGQLAYESVKASHIH